MSTALINRSISTLKTELEFLRDSNVISEDYYKQIANTLPDRYQPGSAPIELGPSEKSHALATAQSGQNRDENAEYVEAIYDYQPQQADDLALKVGDKVKVLEHTSPSWWKGSIGAQTGMFPSNYVKQLEKSVMQRQNSNSPAPSYQSSQQQQQQQQYQPQQPIYNQGNQMPFPPQGYNYPQPEPVPQPAPIQQQPQQQQQQHHHGGDAFKRFGSKLGNAAVFGAGATIGSDLVNSIF